MGKKKTIYQFVTIDQNSKLRIFNYPHTEISLIPFEFIGFHTSKSTRKELQMQPNFYDFCGPMWGGYTSDGNQIIRYESPQAYSALSQ